MLCQDLKRRNQRSNYEVGPINPKSGEPYHIYSRDERLCILASQTECHVAYNLLTGVQLLNTRR